MTAAMVLTWVVLVLLAFALAGILRQLRDVQAELRANAARSSRDSTAPEPVRPTDAASLAVVLIADDNCPICADLAPLLPELAEDTPPDVEFVVLTASASAKWEALATGRVRAVADRETFLAVDPGWRPALLAIDPAGSVLAAEPVGSVDALRRLVTHFAGTQMTIANR